MGKINQNFGLELARTVKIMVILKLNEKVIMSYEGCVISVTDTGFSQKYAKC